MIRRGHARTETRGVMVSATSSPTVEREVMVAVLRAGEGARAIGPRILAFLGLRDFDRSAPFGILVPHPRRVRGRIEFAWFSDPCPDDGRVLIEGIPTPTPGRLMVEQARWETGPDHLTSIDVGRWARRPDLGQLRAALDPLPDDYDPAVATRLVLREGDLDSESPGERRMWEAFGPLAARFEKQVWVGRRRVDGLDREAMVAAEYDGADHHTENGKARDRERDRELRDAGVEPFHVRAEDLADPVRLQARLWHAIQEQLGRMDRGQNPAT